MTASVSVADSDEMKSLDIFSANDTRRMLDVEFASQLLGYERNGISNESARSINELYDKYSNEYPTAAADTSKVRKSLRKIRSLISEDPTKDFFETQNNIYTLHAFLDIEPDRDEAVVRDALTEFVNAYRTAPAESDPDAEVDKNVADYRKGASSRTRSKSSRSLRVFALRNWVRKHLGEALRDSTDSV